jgi:tellurite methyltransferase
MPETLAEWDERHRESAAAGKLPEPANIVTELLPLLPRGAALDVACGSGRHALFLAQRGWHVTAVDGSRVALERVQEAARQESVTATVRRSVAEKPRAKNSGIEVVHGDLEHTYLPANRYDVIVCIHYLQRSLFPQFAAALRAGGMLLMETFTKAQLRFTGGPRSPGYLLECGELRQAFPGLHTIFSRELSAGQGIASLLAQKRAQT